MATITMVKPCYNRNKLEILEVTKWRKDQWRMIKNEWRMMKDDDFKLLKGFADKWTDGWTDIYDCRVAVATEKDFKASIQLMIHNH